ncbi:DUF4864 domain-containing protein [Rhodovulum sp. DZ06]|uniref:DUF4864 domain-containing protein n=1 Tax=Rhodovulum sp. DZ06 TaxID=3425126 RepID=UPI003D332978
MRAVIRLTILSALGLALALGPGLAPPAVAAGDAAPSPGAQRAMAEIRAVITAQIAAFRAGDVEAAFAHASPQIRERFVTARNFGAMVRQGYPMVEKSVEQIFGALTPEGGRLRQAVLLKGPEGRLWAADYWLIPVAEGGWRIDGVRIDRKAQGI